MLGAIIGDVVGSVYEWNNIKTKDFPLFSERGFFTDDTVMTVAVADALINGGTSDNFIDSMKKFGKIYPNLGYGARFANWLFTGERQPYNSWGNGSAMRVSPCAWFADSLDEAESLAERSAAVTHNHPEGIKGAQATAASVYLARTGSRGAIKSYIESKYGYDLSRTLDEIRPCYKFDESCQGTVPEAIIAFLESNGFEDAVRNAISLGGDSDTLAAITGSIAEAAYGVPSIITTNAYYFVDDTLASVINAWLDMGKPIGAVVKKRDWRAEGFSRPSFVKINFSFNDKHYARIRHGLLPERPEDKWFAYFEYGRICFHRSRTGIKVFEAEINKEGAGYGITELMVERDAEKYSCFDEEDINLFYALIAGELLGLEAAAPRNIGDRS